MIRGAIEIVEADRMAGWLYCVESPLERKLALAFLGARCVGSGPIGSLREDLKAAGLGDGLAGFDFPIKVERADELPALVIKLQLCDFVLLQRNVVIRARKPVAVRARPRLAVAAC